MAAMDDIGLRYLLLGLRLGRHLPELIGSYVGPSELAEAVASEAPTPLDELHIEALRLADLAAELPFETPILRRRAQWFVAQLRAMSALARRVGGEEIGFVDLVEELYDVEVQLEPESTFETARGMLDAVLPGRAPLRERLATHDRNSQVPPDRLVDVVSGFASVLRRRTRAQLWLPEHESISFEAAHDAAWETDARYLGSGRSRVRVNLDAPMTLAAAVELAAQAGYPGRHAEAVVKDALLIQGGHAELALSTELSPQAVLGEGMKTLAREVVMSDQEVRVELSRIARSLDQQIDMQAELMLQRALRLMVPALGNAAVALHRDGEPISQVRAYLADVALISDDRLDRSTACLIDPVWSTHAFTAIDGRRLISEWLEVQGQTRGFGRLLSEQLTPGQLRAELARP